MGRVVVSGAIANKPWNGGAAWTRLCWLLGVRSLGFETFFIEQIDPSTGHDGVGPVELAASDQVAFFRRVMGQFGLEDACALVSTNGTTVVGPSPAELEAIAAEADLLINISGHLRMPRLRSRFRRAVYVDLDPGYTQFWQSEGRDVGLSGHDEFYTVGANIGTARCGIPTCGINWRAVRQPVVLDQWPLQPAPMAPRFTTIASWRGPYGVIERGDIRLGPKAHEFRRFLELPSLVGAQFEIALEMHAGDAKDRTALETAGWIVSDPRQVVADPLAFRAFVQDSAAEFSVAQGMYVHTASGWVSDRTVRYLASGRPALVQDTGLCAELRTEKGLVTFRTLDEAAAGATAILQDYPAHRAAARELAERFFTPARVLADVVGVGARSARAGALEGV